MHDAALTDLLQAASEMAQGTSPEEFEVDLGDFLPRFYEDVAPEDLVGKDPIDVVGPATNMLRLGANRPQGTAVVDVFTPTVAHNEWTSGHTVVQVITDDMPFLLDSVVAAITEGGQSLHLVAHPIFAVRRDAAGALKEVVPGPVEDAGEGTIRESWIHLEIDLATDPAAHAALEKRLLSVLEDVRQAVEDWPRMTNTALTLADQLRADPPATIEARRVQEAADFLQWLGEGNFTFLGYREYDLVRDPDPVALRSQPGSGLGLLRSDTSESQSFSELPPEVRKHATEHRILVLTKANTRSTVHRPVRLDYVGVKRFDDAGEVIGEHRFIGLFTSSTYNQSVLQIPVLRRRVDELFELTGFASGTHSGKDLLQFCETYPRDDFFQTDAAELFPIARAVLQIHQRRRTRLFTRPDRYGRYVSCLVYLPRDRYNTKVRERIQKTLLDAYGGQTVDHTALLTESVLARLHMVVHMPPGVPIPQVDTAALENELAQVVRSWDDHLAQSLLTAAGEALWWELNGDPVQPIRPRRPMHKTLSRGGSLGAAVTDPMELYAWLVRNLERLIEELRYHEVRPGRVTLWVSYRHGEFRVAPTRLAPPTERFDMLIEALRPCLRRCWIPKAAAERMHLIADDLMPRTETQLGLFDPAGQAEQAEAVARLKEQVNERHGRFMLRSAATLPLKAIYRDPANGHDRSERFEFFRIDNCRDG